MRLPISGGRMPGWGNGNPLWLDVRVLIKYMNIWSDAAAKQAYNLECLGQAMDESQEAKDEARWCECKMMPDRATDSPIQKDAFFTAV